MYLVIFPESPENVSITPRCKQITIGVGEDNLAIFMAVFVIKNVHSEMLFVNLKLVFFNGPKSINDTFNTIF